MSPSSVVVTVLFVLCFQSFLEYRDWADWSRKDVMRVAPGPCTTVIKDGGSEDLLHIGDNKVLISQGVNFDFAVGQLLFLDLDTNEVTKADIANAPARADFLAVAHGLTSWKDDETGQLFIYVLTHPATGDCVEVLEVSKNLTLTYIRTITDPSFTFMNDMVAVGRDQFYITSIWGSRRNPYITMETWLRLRNGRIVYYDGEKGREVASGYFMANGINIAADKKTIYMAESGYKTVHAFKRDESYNLQHLWARIGANPDTTISSVIDADTMISAYDAGTIVDNIDVDPGTGDLWIGSHPILWIALDYLQVFSGVTLPSQVIRMKLRDNIVSEVEEIYSDNGNEIAGSTVGAYVNGKLVVGSVSTTTVVCDVNYLSP